jgi:hypothetical protein
MSEQKMMPEEFSEAHTIFRYTVVQLASGQPRPYADHFGRVRIALEIKAHRMNGAGEWKPNDDWKEEEVRELAKNLKCGFPKKDPESWADTNVTSFTKIAPGIWEFTTTAAYTG